MVRNVHASDRLDGRAEFDAGREWLGLIAYRLTGKIDELLPSPKPTNPDADDALNSLAVPK